MDTFGAVGKTHLVTPKVSEPVEYGNNVKRTGQVVGPQGVHWGCVKTTLRRNGTAETVAYEADSVRRASSYWLLGRIVTVTTADSESGVGSTQRVVSETLLLVGSTQTVVGVAVTVVVVLRGGDTVTVVVRGGDTVTVVVRGGDTVTVVVRGGDMVTVVVRGGDTVTVVVRGGDTVTVVVVERGDDTCT
jgi:hypothetical protein